METVDIYTVMINKKWIINRVKHKRGQPGKIK